MARKGENIYKRKDGRWEGRYIKDRDNDNKAIYGYVYAKSYTDVRAKLKETETNIITKRTCNNAQHTLSEWIDRWLIQKESSVKQSTYIRYKNNIESHIRPVLGTSNVGLIDTRVLQGFVTDKLENGRIDKKGGLSEKTLFELMLIIKNILNYSKVNGEDISCDFNQISIKKKHHEMRVLSLEEERNLNKVLFSDLDIYKLGVLICLYTGIRIGELCALQWKNISFRDRTLKIEKTMQRIQCQNMNKKTSIIITEPKTQSSYRIIPLPGFLIHELKKYKSNDEDFVLKYKDKNFTEPRTMQNRFKKYLTLANIENANFHSLRHTFATRCVEAGFEIKALSEILGHSSVQITLDKYVHITMEMKKANMTKVKLAI